MKIRKWITAAAAALLTAVFIGGCSIDLDLMFKAPDARRPTGSSPFDNASYLDWPEDSFDETSFDFSKVETPQGDYALIHTLSDEEKELYQHIIARIESLESSMIFDEVTNDAFKNAYYAVLYDHPEYFWTGRNYSYTVRTLGDLQKLSVQPSLLFEDSETIRQARKALEDAANMIAAGAEQQDGIYEKVKYVHDYIIDHTAYDTDALESISNGEDESVMAATTAYGCLVQHKAVCSGYASAFQLVLQKLGIECGRVNGLRNSESGAHQWNFLRLDDDYYYTDVTWDDPLKPDGTQTRTYEFFLISEDDLAYTHVKNNDLPCPECRGTQYDFYRMNHLYFEEYDFDDIRVAADLMYDDRALTVKYSSPDVLSEAKRELIDNKRIFDIGYIGGGVTYSVSSSGCILNISY